MSDDIVDRASEFPLDYKLRMIRAYPIIAQMDADEDLFGTVADRDVAFLRILRSNNLRRVHELFLEEADHTDE